MSEQNRNAYDVDSLVVLAVEEVEKALGHRMGVEARIRFIQWLCRAYEMGRGSPRDKREK